MTYGVSIGLVVVGVVLGILGFNASESISSDISRLFSGTPSNKTVWLFAVGVLMVVVGGYGLITGQRAP
jgi:hypothetical protein